MKAKERASAKAPRKQQVAYLTRPQNKGGPASVVGVTEGKAMAGRLRRGR